MVALGIWLTSRRGATRRTNPEVPIQNGKTIDFSSGKPVVKDEAKDKAAIDQAVAAMDAATKNVTFTPKAAPTPSTAPSK